MSAAPPSAAAAAGAPPADPGSVLARYQLELAGRGLSADPEQRAAVAPLDDLRRRLIGAPVARGRLARWLHALGVRGATQPVRGLYLWGGVGRGKTWLMDLFYDSLPFPERRRRHFHRFMHDVHAELGRLRHQRSPLERVAAQLARQVRVLCLDELHVADIADAMILGTLFGALLRRGVTLVATSNVAPQQLYREGLQRERFLPAVALLVEHLEVLRIAGTTDYRLRQLTHAGIYLAADAPHTSARLAALFETLTDHATQSGGALEIEGRPIGVIRAGTNVVWCDFRALCAGPRSQEDYIEIAREFQALIVSGVPVFDALHEDEARRFIALVDELYDHNVKLIVSAAAPPGELYRGERLGALFARTASRLTEMQSAQYLAREHRP